MRNKIIFLSLVFICIYASLGFTQVTQLNNVRPATPAFNGWDGTGPNAGSLEIRNDFNNRINLSTFTVQKATILANGNTGIGDAGSGTNFTTFPNYRLDIDLGDININQLGNGYRIGDGNAATSEYVLWLNSLTDNIYVGVSPNRSSVTGHPNTLVGWNAGDGLVAGSANTLVGDQAGLVLGGSGGNTFVGHEAGITQSGGGENTFIGSFSGRQNLSGAGNTYVGEQSGRACSTGRDNVMVGASAGLNNLSTNNSFLGSNAGVANTGGSLNTFVGFNSAFTNLTGTGTTSVGARSGALSRLDFNTFLGCSTNVAATTVTNASAIGANAIVPDDDEMILGDNSVNVGIGLSNDNTNGLTYVGPGNKLEINAGHYGANTFERPAALDPAYSGLRFRDMTNICKSEINEGPGILSVNGDGDVIYVEDIGNYCGETPQRPLRADYEVPLFDGFNGHDYNFTGQGLLTTNVAIGQTCGNTKPYAKLQSFQFTNQTSLLASESNAGLFYTSTTDKLAIGGVGISNASPYTNIGLKGIVTEYRGINNTGVLGTTVAYPVVLGGNLNVGVYGYATQRPVTTSTHWNLAVVGDLGPTVNPPIGTLGDFAGYFNGDIGTTAGSFILSDSTLKENIQDISNPMDIINQLNPKSYTLRQSENESMILPVGTHYGVLAQNLESVLPNAVKNCVHPARLDSVGNEIYPEINYLAINNNEIIPFLVAAIKEQQQTMEAMQAELANLNGGGNRQGHPGNEDGGEGEGQEKTNSVDVELSNVKAIILNQNVPNPFAEQTTITFFIPDEVKNAQIFFYDNTGLILKTIDIKEKGAGQLNVFAADLSSGSYTYSLIADGNLIETKKMIKTN